MANRVVRADILTSDTVNKLSWAAEVFYRRLMSVVDDYGRYESRLAMLRSSLYPLKLDRVSESDVAKWMNECSEAGLVRVYTVDGKGYLEILKFKQTIRIKKQKFPAPAQHMQADASICKQTTSICVSGDGDGDGVGVESVSRVETGDGDESAITSPPPPVFISHAPDESQQINLTGPAEDEPLTFSERISGGRQISYKDISPMQMHIARDISECAELYFNSDYFGATRQSLQCSLSIDYSLLRDWGDEFCKQQIQQGRAQKVLSDFAQHFNNWIKKQDITKNPKKAFEYEPRGAANKEKRRSSPGANEFYESIRGGNS